MPSLIKTLQIGSTVTNRILHPRISHANIALTMQCNHKCYCCNIWKNNNHSTDYISSNDITKIITNNDLMWVSLTGGEPFLNRDIHDILYQCLSRLKLTYIVTNGSHPDRIASAILNALMGTYDCANILFVNFSLLGNSETNDSLTNVPNSYNKVIECINKLKGYFPSRLHIGIHHAISEQSKDNWKDLITLGEKLGVAVTYTPETQADYFNNTNNHKLLSPPTLPLSSKNAFMYCYTKYMWGKKTGCVAGQYSCFIMPDKTVYPCFFAVPKQPEYNLKDTGYKLKQTHKTNNWIKECKGCSTLCEIKSTLIFRPWRLL